jgi:hypothetical protein
MLFSLQETCITLLESQILTKSELELEQEPPNTPY